MAGHAVSSFVSLANNFFDGSGANTAEDTTADDDGGVVDDSYDASYQDDG
jgi:hypothetical protein